jgi:hypothetical protein
MNKLILPFVFILGLFTSCNNDSTDTPTPTIAKEIYEPVDRYVNRKIVVLENGIKYHFSMDYGLDTLNDLTIQPLGNDYILNVQGVETVCRKINFQIHPVGTYTIRSVGISAPLLDRIKYESLVNTKVTITENSIDFEGLNITPINLGVVYRFYENNYEHLITEGGVGDLRIYLVNSKYPTMNNVDIYFE